MTNIYRPMQIPADARCVVQGRLGTIIGAYIYPFHHEYFYKAFHIKFDDGERTTLHASLVHKLRSKEG